MWGFFKSVIEVIFNPTVHSYERLGDWVEARKSMEKALELDPGNTRYKKCLDGILEGFDREVRSE